MRAALALLCILPVLLEQCRHAEAGDGAPAEEKGAVFESTKDITTEVVEVLTDVVETIKSLIWGRRRASAGGAHQGPGATSAAGGADEEEEGEPLASFCGLELGPAGAAVNCACCADHLLGDPVAVAALLYGSGPSEARAFARDPEGLDRRIGHARAWSLGSRRPSLLCDRGRPLCRCEDEAWHAEEPACSQGGLCVAPAGVPEELPSSLPGNSSRGAESGGLGLPDCAGDLPGRVPIGSAHCEDMSVRQCSLFYARGPEGWHHCEVDAHAVRTCGAKVGFDVKEGPLLENLQHWAVQRAYSPSLDWPLLERADHTARVVSSPAPSAEAVRGALQALRAP